MQKLALRPRLSSPHLEPRGFVEERRESARACARAAERCCLSRKVIISVGSAILHQPPWLRRPRCSLASAHIHLWAPRYAPDACVSAPAGRKSGARAGPYRGDHGTSHPSTLIRYCSSCLIRAGSPSRSWRPRGSGIAGHRLCHGDCLRRERHGFCHRLPRECDRLTRVVDRVRLVDRCCRARDNDFFSRQRPVAGWTLHGLR